MSDANQGAGGETPTIEDEARAAHSRYIELREQVLAGEAGWEALSECFTDDAVFIDPAWGRVQGIAAITEFLSESMAGLEGWNFPEVFTMFDGRRVVSMWDQEFTGPNGAAVQPGISVMYYAGGGKFCYEMDLLNMAHVMEDISRTGWMPGDGFNMPPAVPDRDWSTDAIAHHLESDA